MKKMCRAISIVGLAAALAAGCKGGGGGDDDADAGPDGSSEIAECVDQDGDGFGANCENGPDCDDTDSTLNAISESYPDTDGDGRGAGAPLTLCIGQEPPAGYVADGTDCDDGNEAIYQLLSGYADADGDGYGAGEASQVCSGESLAAGSVDNNTDCDDSSAAVYQLLSGYPDADGDGHGAGSAEESACSGAALVAGYATANDDCDDKDPTEWDECDDSCVDEDGDGFYVGCDSYHAVPGPDCSDDTGTDALAAQHYPGAFEIPGDGIDQDCFGADLVATDDTGIFVSDAAGDNANPGTKSAPVKTLTQGIILAQAANPQKTVFVDKGTYTESINTAVSLYGGFDRAGGWTRSTSNTTRIEGIASRTVTVESGDVTIDGFEVETYPLSGGLAVEIRGATVTLSNDSISGGGVTDVVYGDNGSVRAGVIYAEQGDVTLANCQVSGGGAVVSGALFSPGFEGQVRLVAVELKNSTARIQKSALDCGSATMNFMSSAGATATGELSALSLQNSTASVLSTTVGCAPFSMVGTISVYGAPPPVEVSNQSWGRVVQMQDSSLFVQGGAWNCAGGTVVVTINPQDGEPDLMLRDSEVKVAADTLSAVVDQSGPGQLFMQKVDVNQSSPSATIASSFGGDFRNTGAMAISSGVFGVRAAGPGATTLLGNTFHVNGGGGTLSTDGATGALSVTVEQVAVALSGSGRRVLDSNVLVVASANAMLSCASGSDSAEILAKVVRSIVQSDGSGLVVLTNNAMTAQPGTASATGIDAASVTAEGQAKGVALAGTGTRAVVNNTIRTMPNTVNTDDGSGGGTKTNNVFGIWLSGPTAVLANDIVTTGADTADWVTRVVAVEGGSLTLQNNDLWGDGGQFDCLLHDGSGCARTAAEVNACAASACASVSGNLGVDPDTAGGNDMLLNSTSPCRNAGIDPSTLGYPNIRDIDDDVRPNESIWDIGSDEYWE